MIIVVCVIAYQKCFHTKIDTLRTGLNSLTVLQNTTWTVRFNTNFALPNGYRKLLEFVKFGFSRWRKMCLGCMHFHAHHSALKPENCHIFVCTQPIELIFITYISSWNITFLASFSKQLCVAYLLPYYIIGGDSPFFTN